MEVGTDNKTINKTLNKKANRVKQTNNNHRPFLYYVSVGKNFLEIITYIT